MHWFISRNPDGETDGVNFHRVFVYDEGLRQYIQNHLQRSDRVLLTGRIGHMTSTGTDGKKVYSGFVIADSIYRVARRAKGDTITSNVTDQVTAENWTKTRRFFNKIDTILYEWIK